jgi:hypothetical protein
MKYLCLGYGAESDWKALTKEEQDLLAEDEVLRRRKPAKRAVQATVTTIRVWDGKPNTTNGQVCDSPVPLAGFSVIEALDVNDAIRLVAATPCARAKGAIEIRPTICNQRFLN